MLRSPLYEEKIYSQRLAKKPKLTEKMKKARQHKHLTIENWEKVYILNFVQLLQILLVFG